MDDTTVAAHKDVLVSLASDESSHLYFVLGHGHTLPEKV